MRQTMAGLTLATGLVLVLAGCAKSGSTSTPAAGTIIEPNTPATTTPTGSAETSPPVANSAMAASENAGVIGSDTVGSASVVTGPAENAAAAGGGAGPAANAMREKNTVAPSGRAAVTGTAGPSQGTAGPSQGTAGPSQGTAH